MQVTENIHQTAAHLFRHESGKMLAVLVKLFGLPQVEVAEDIVQETLLAAVESWKLKGMPDDPRAWLYRTAKHKTIDFLRRERNFRDNIAPNFAQQNLQNAAPTQWMDVFFLDAEIEDAQLRMMFACCHPAIPAESQMSLMLRSLCGLSNREIAAALLLPEDTVAKRLYRAKEKIREEKLRLEVPIGEQLLPRLDAVLQAVYLLFNEGYKSSTTAAVIRHDLCEEALRLGDLLSNNQHSHLPKTHALQALMCFHAGRFAARMDDAGDIVLLENQDRSRWDRRLIGLGYMHLRDASVGNAISEYHLEAAIASYHVGSPSFGQTNWKAIFYCYDLLLKINPSPVVAMNRAIALGYADGAKAGIEALVQVEGLENNHLFHAALGDFQSKAGDVKTAIGSYEMAMKMAQLPAERKVLSAKLALVAQPKIQG
jgi:RNA polymerase sigma factor (sigma-70 family)